MVSMKLWRLFLLVTIECVTIFSAPEKEYYCIGKLLKTLNAISNVPILKNSYNLYMKANDLKCGFIYSAHFHMHWTRQLYLEKDPEIIKQFPVDQISFVEESIKIINLLFDRKSIQMNQIWLFYWYAEKINSFYKDFVEIKGMNDFGRLTRIVENHDTVFAELQSYLMVNCEENYYFDPHCEDCEYYQNVISVPGINQISHFTVYVLNVIKFNKTLLNELLETTKITNTDHASHVPFSSTLQLYFSSFYVASMYETFWKENLDAKRWDLVLLSIKNVKKVAMYSEILGGIGIPDIGIYQQMVIDLLKIIMLNKIKRYLVYVFKHENDLSSTIEDYSAIITQFIEAMALVEDHFFVYIKHSLNDDYLKNSRNRDIIQKEIEYQINTISKTWNFAYEFMDENLKTTPIDLVTSGNNFISKLKTTFGPSSNFFYTHSFIKMVNYITYKTDISKNRETRINHTVELAFN